MSKVTVDVYRLIDGAAIGAVRLEVPGRTIILLDDRLPLDEQTALLDELVKPDEQVVFVNAFPEIPAQRSVGADVTSRVG